MINNIQIPSKTKSGEDILLKIVPELIPGINGRKSITGLFRIYKLQEKENGAIDETISTGLDKQEIISKGALCFLNENFFEWKYDGDALSENELHLIVDRIQNTIEDHLKHINKIPQSEFDNKPLPEDSLNSSIDWVDELDKDEFLKISPYFLHGPADDLIAIVENGNGFDILVNDSIVAKLVRDENKEWIVMPGGLLENPLLVEILRRIEAINELLS